MKRIEQLVNVMEDSIDNDDFDHWNSGLAHTQLIDCFQIYTDNALDKSTFYQLTSRCISMYMQNLQNLKVILHYQASTNAERFKYEHHLISFIHEDNEDLSMELMHRFPIAYEGLDEPWTKWTQMIK